MEKRVRSGVEMGERRLGGREKTHAGASPSRRAAVRPHSLFLLHRTPRTSVSRSSSPACTVSTAARTRCFSSEVGGGAAAAAAAAALLAAAADARAASAAPVTDEIVLRIVASTTSVGASARTARRRGEERAVEERAERMRSGVAARGVAAARPPGAAGRTWAPGWARRRRDGMGRVGEGEDARKGGVGREE